VRLCRISNARSMTFGLTLRVRGEAVCASLQGMPFEPCFRIEKTDDLSFRGSWMGDFTRRTNIAVMSPRRHSSEPLTLESDGAGPN
jgi:hypothetical protein